MKTMTRRYFFSDPIAASWQIKHHGFVCYMGDLAGRDYDTYGNVPGHNDHPHVVIDDWDMRNRRGSPAEPVDRIYVHPVSHRLLEPITGDMVALANGSEAHRYGRAGGPTGIKLDPGEKIVMRNGIPYFWPEVSG